MPEGASTDLTVGETYRNLIALRADFTRFTSKLDELPDWQDIRRIEKAQEAKIKELQDSVKWGMRLIITSVVGVIINIIYISAQVPGAS